jgi:lysozyme
MTNLRGKVSWFGGPSDTDVAPDEGLAFLYDVSDAPQLFLDEQPPGTTGLARRLDSDNVFYIATRWDYDIYPKSMLPDMRVKVTATKTGKSIICTPADWGPHQDTNRCADVSRATLAALGIETDDEIEIEFPYQGVEPMSDDCKIIDISHHQDFPSFDQVAAAGVIAMIHKATEGSSYVDPNRARNCSNAIKAGIACCTYHWLKPGNAKQQIAFYLKTIDPMPGERMVIDYEEDGCTLSDLKEAVQALLDDPRGLQVTVYSGHLLKEQLGSKHDAFLADNTDLWLAQYTSGTPSWSIGTYPQWTLWQYSETGHIDGIGDNYVDLNRFNGSDENLVKWISPAGGVEPVPPEPLPEMASVHFNVQTSGQVAVSIAINGEVIYGDDPQFS